MYLSFIQHKNNIEMICNPKLTLCSRFDTEINYKDLELMYLKPFETPWEQPYKESIFNV